MEIYLKLEICEIITCSHILFRGNIVFIRFNTSRNLVTPYWNIQE